jgi:hypothetical protein
MNEAYYTVNIDEIKTRSVERLIAPLIHFVSLMILVIGGGAFLFM